MSNPAQPPEDRRRFVVKSEQPVRAYAIAAYCSLLGAILLVMGPLRDSRFLTVVAVVVLGFGVVLAALAFWLRRLYRTTLIAEKSTLTLVNGRRRRVLQWSEIADVSLQRARLVFTPKGPGRRQAVIIDPTLTGQPMFTEMLTELRKRLDASRGYRS